MPAVIGDWLAHRAALSPDGVALIDATDGDSGEASRITYRAWNRRVDRTAQALRALGVERGERVAVLAKNCAEYLDLFFACGKLGAILQALNWRLATAELAALIADGEPIIVVYDRDFAGLAGELAQTGAAPRTWIATGPPADDSTGQAGPAGPHLAQLVAAAPDRPPPTVELEWGSPWALCYTGGTTGLPKGAILSHRSITWNAINTASGWDLGADDLAILNAPLFHTGGLNVFTTPLVHVGGASIICRGFDTEQLLSLMQAHPVTCLFGVPTMFIDIQAHPRFDAIPWEKVRVLISGGAPCPLPVFERFWARGVDFRSGYGLTEAGPNNFWLPTAELRRKPGAVGFPLMHVDARIIGPDGSSCGADEVGELRLRGPHLFAGYWRSPASSDAALDEEGWLRTGDLASADMDGCVTIVGRAKDMFISGGENVYPAEIEAVLAGHPEVAEVAVVGTPHPRWGEVGVAFVVRRTIVEDPADHGRQDDSEDDARLDVAETPTLDEASLLDYARERLARYKVPKTARFVAALPRTGAGKIDKRALAFAYAEPGSQR